MGDLWRSDWQHSYVWLSAQGTEIGEVDLDVAFLLRARAPKETLTRVMNLGLVCGKVLPVLCIDCEKLTNQKNLSASRRLKKGGTLVIFLEWGCFAAAKMIPFIPMNQRHDWGCCGHPEIFAHL